MEIIESIVWVAVGFVPTLVALKALVGGGSTTIKGESSEIKAKRESEVVISSE